MITKLCPSLVLGDKRLAELFDEGLMAIVLRREYDHAARCGRLWLHGMGCADMDGAIGWAEALDAGAKRVEVFNEVEGFINAYERVSACANTRHALQWRYATSRLHECSAVPASRSCSPAQRCSSF